MRWASRTILCIAPTVAICAVASAAVAPRPHASYLGLEFGHFSIILDTNGKRIVAGSAGPSTGQHPVSGALVVCPASVPGEPVRELHVGFPGATLKAAGHRYRFKRSYTENKAHLVVVVGQVTTTVTGVHVSVTGTVVNPTLIVGTISVTASGCDLSSRNYRAKFISTLPA